MYMRCMRDRHGKSSCDDVIAFMNTPNQVPAHMCKYTRDFINTSAILDALCTGAKIKRKLRISINLIFSAIIFQRSHKKFLNVFQVY